MIRLGRIAGVEVDADWSVALIGWLIWWSLSDSLLPSAASGYGTSTYWAVGFVLALIFEGSLLAHELGHATVARRLGIQVERVTLWLLGGIARLDASERGAAGELRIALAGPAVSLGLGVLGLAVGGAIAAMAAPKLLTVAIVWFGVTQLLLGGFNLLPAFPLDGGRVYRAWRWKRTGDRRVATASAARLGRAVGFGLVGVGLLELAAGALISGVWMALIGMFVVSAGRSEEWAVELDEALGHYRVADLMSDHPVTVPPHLTIDELIEGWVLAGRHSAYPLVDSHGRPTGLVSLQRIRTVRPSQRATTTVADVARPVGEIPLAHPEEPAEVLPRRVADAPEARVLVVDKAGRLVGIVTSLDVSRLVEINRLRAGYRRPTEEAVRGAPDLRPGRKSTSAAR